MGHVAAWEFRGVRLTLSPLSLQPCCLPLRSTGHRALRHPAWAWRAMVAAAAEVWRAAIPTFCWWGQTASENSLSEPAGSPNAGLPPALTEPLFRPCRPSPAPPRQRAPRGSASGRRPDSSGWVTWPPRAPRPAVPFRGLSDPGTSSNVPLSVSPEPAPSARRPALFLPHRCLSSGRAASQRASRAGRGGGARGSKWAPGRSGASGPSPRRRPPRGRTARNKPPTRRLKPAAPNPLSSPPPHDKTLFAPNPRLRRRRGEAPGPRAQLPERPRRGRRAPPRPGAALGGGGEEPPPPVQAHAAPGAPLRPSLGCARSPRRR